MIQVLKHPQYGADPEQDLVAFELRRPLPQPEPDPEPDPEPAPEPDPEPDPQPEQVQTSSGAAESATDEAERLRQRRIEESASAAVETDSVFGVLSELLGEDDARGGGDGDGECFSTPRASETPVNPFGTPSEGIPPCTDEGEVVD